MSSPSAWTTSGCSSTRAIPCSEQRLRTYGSSRMSPRLRPRRCSRTTYAATCFSLRLPAKRKENGLRQKDFSPATGPILSVLYPCPMKQVTASGRYAERVLDCVDDAGAPERIVLWIARKEGGVWAVGRAVNPQHRSSDVPRA